MRSKFRTRQDLLVALVFALVGSVVAWLRLPYLTQQTVWAEDGTIFLNDAISGSPAEHLMSAYAGYLQFVPRVLADFSVRIGALDAAGSTINFASCVVVGGAAALVYWCSQDLLASRALRAVLSSITLLAPLVPIEILGNAANLHWFFVWMMLWVLLYSPRTKTGAWLLAAVALACALSEIQLLIFLPVFLLNAKTSLVWPVRLAVAAGLLAQIVTTVLSPRSAHSGGLGGVLRNYVAQVALPNYSANRHVMDAALSQQPLFWEAVAIIPFLLACGVALRWGTQLQRVAAVYLVPGSFVLWVADAFLNGWGGSPLSPQPFQFVRYAVVPSMFLLASIVLAAQVLLSHPSRIARQTSVVVVTALLAMMVVQYAPSETTRSQGPSWDASIDEAQHQCADVSKSAQQSIVVAPTVHRIVWNFDISCARLKE